MNEYDLSLFAVTLTRNDFISFAWPRNVWSQFCGLKIPRVCNVGLEVTRVQFLGLEMIGVTFVGREDFTMRTI